jgi:hypothetical protein
VSITAAHLELVREGVHRLGADAVQAHENWNTSSLNLNWSTLLSMISFCSPTGRFLPDTQAAAASGSAPRLTAPWWNVREHCAAGGELPQGAARLVLVLPESAHRRTDDPDHRSPDPGPARHCLGLEHLDRDDPASLVDTVRTAVEGGVNFIDLTVMTPEARDRMGDALRGMRDRVLLAGHLGFGWADGKSGIVRDRETSGQVFDDLLSRLRTDRVELVWLTFVDTPEDYAGVMTEDGLLGLARDLRRSGKARFIGLSTHVSQMARRSAPGRSGASCTSAASSGGSPWWP